MLYIIVVLLLLGGGALTIVAIQNFTAQQAHVALLIWQTPELPIGLIVVLAFLLGALLLYIVSALAAWRDKREIRHLQKRVAELEQASVPMGAVPTQPPLPQSDVQVQ